MELLGLPHTTNVNKVIPKNTFYNYTNAKQKKLFADLILKITWKHKLSSDTVNLEAKEIKEIQIFLIEMKVKQDVMCILNLIDKLMPYHIIFIVAFDGEMFLSTSPKHPNPIDENKAVIDWTFKTDWFLKQENHYQIRLKKDIDTVYTDFCFQLSNNRNISQDSLTQLVEVSKSISQLEKEINQLKARLNNVRLFKEKVELNLLLKQKQQVLRSIIK